MNCVDEKPTTKTHSLYQDIKISLSLVRQHENEELMLRSLEDLNLIKGNANSFEV